MLNSGSGTSASEVGALSFGVPPSLGSPGRGTEGSAKPEPSVLASFYSFAAASTFFFSP